MQSDTTVVSIAAVFFKKAAIVIAIHGQKTLHWQLSKVILSGTYNCNFEAINYERMNKLDEWMNGLYLTLCIRFRKEFLMLSLR